MPSDGGGLVVRASLAAPANGLVLRKKVKGPEKVSGMQKEGLTMCFGLTSHNYRPVNLKIVPSNDVNIH